MMRISTVAAVPRLLSGRLPFYYGWVILGCLCCAGFARQGPAVATLSIFVEPLSREFGWSRAALSGAVSLGGVLAALASPLIGPWVDRHGSRATLSLAVLVTGAAMLLLSLTPSLLVFYLCVTMPAICATVAIEFANGRRLPDGRHALDDRNIHGNRRICLRRVVRLWHRRIADIAAACLGRLFRPCQFCGDPRYRAVRAGAGAGRGTAAFGCAARWDRKLRAFAAKFCCAIGVRRGRGAARAPACSACN